ncbi:MAG: 4-carboxymuconolactone decarboxylase [Gammaproteobacteria bacterium]
MWVRPGLKKKTGGFLSMTGLAAFGRHGELRTHIRAAVANGATGDDTREVILHVDVNCGLPVALQSILIAKEVLDELNV